MPDESAHEISVSIKGDTDVIVACQKGRTLAARLGFSSDDQVVVVIAISEVARNIVRYAQAGEITIASVRRDDKHGVAVAAYDEGPGIPDIEQALQDGYSTGGGLGLGLSGAKRLMDEFKISSQVGKGTTIEMIKWKQ